MSDAVDFDASVRISREVLFREIDGEAVLLNLDTGKYFGLDEVGTAIWSLLAERRTPRVVLGILAETYEAPRERLEADLCLFLERLREHQLIDTEPA